MRIRQKYPCAYFVHCYAPQLNLFMQKSASQDSRVRVFFQNLSAIPAFFSNFLYRCDVLQEIFKRQLPQVDTTRWNYNIRLVDIVFESQDALIEVFEEIEETHLEGPTTHEAYALRCALERSKVHVLVNAFPQNYAACKYTLYQLQSKNKTSIQVQKDILVFNLEAWCHSIYQ